MNGDSVISVGRESNLTIKGKHYKGTRGLWELLARKDVNSDVITESDLKKYDYSRGDQRSFGGIRTGE